MNGDTCSALANRMPSLASAASDVTGRTYAVRSCQGVLVTSAISVSTRSPVSSNAR